LGNTRKSHPLIKVSVVSKKDTHTQLKRLRDKIVGITRKVHTQFMGVSGKIVGITLKEHTPLKGVSAKTVALHERHTLHSWELVARL
jgi:hypothetical protein